jgi:hypothetical protein
MIGNDLAFTNSQGAFYLRLRKTQAVPFAVALDEFVVPGRYELVLAPNEVLPALDGEAQDYEVVVRRLPNASQVWEAGSSEE